MSEPLALAIVGAGLSALALLRGLAESDFGGPIALFEHQAAIGGSLRDALPAAEFAAESELLRAPAISDAITLRTATTAVGLLPATTSTGAPTLVVRDRRGTERIRARRIVLACGGLERPREHDQIPGPRPAGVVTPGFVFAALARGYLPGRRAVVYGSSALASLTALRLSAAGITTTVATSSAETPDVPTPVVTSARLVSLRGSARLAGVLLRQDDETIDLDADLLVYAVGLLPNTRWLKGSSIALGDDGAVLVGANAETNVVGVSAIGTVVAPSLDHVGSIRSGERLAAALLGAQ